MTIFKPLVLSLTFLAVCSAPVVAQTTDEAPMRTLFGTDHDLHHGGWGAPTAAWTRLMDQDALLVGLRGGWIIDHRFSIGIAGYGLTTPVENRNYDIHLVEQGVLPHQRSLFRTGYGGLLLEPVIAYRSPVHISLPILIGAGGCGYQTYTDLPGEGIDPETWHDDTDAYFVLEPGIDLEFNLVKLVKLGLGASYRYTSDITLPETAKDALRGFSANMSIKVGVF